MCTIFCKSQYVLDVGSHTIRFTMRTPYVFNTDKMKFGLLGRYFVQTRSHSYHRRARSCNRHTVHVHATDIHVHVTDTLVYATDILILTLGSCRLYFELHRLLLSNSQCLHWLTHTWVKHRLERRWWVQWGRLAWYELMNNDESWWLSAGRWCIGFDHL